MVYPACNLKQRFCCLCFDWVILLNFILENEQGMVRLLNLSQQVEDKIVVSRQSLPDIFVVSQEFP